MDEITIGEKTYISSKQAAKITGYAKDYIGQLCREGRVEARLVGRNWYVLDSAIREHRFGKVEEEAPEEPVAAAAPDRSSTWKKPQYEAETPVLVPNFAKKETEEIGTPAIADMQSAWREWFEDKKQTEEPAVDAEAQTPINDAPESLPETVDPVLPETVHAKEEAVVITRVQPIEERFETSAPSEEERVDINRIHATVPTPTPVAVPIILGRELVSPYTKEDEKVPSPKGRGLGTAVTRSLLIVASITAVLIALIGTGHAEPYFSGTSLDFGVQKEVVDFLGGMSTYESTF